MDDRKILQLQALVLIGDFNCPAQKDNTAGHKQSSRFLVCIDSNFLLQVTDEPRRRGSFLDLIVTTKEGLVEDMKVKDNLCCRDHVTVEFWILRERERVKRKLTAPHFRIADFGLFKCLLGRVQWDRALERRVAQES